MFLRTFILTISLCLFLPSFSENKDLRTLHSNRHKELLANNRSQLDKSVIENYFKQELEIKENPGNKKLTESEQMVIDLLVEAKSHLGKRYRSGGKGPNAFDCSGFAGYVYKQFGYNLGASSRDQYNDGISIIKEELKPGDLVFFTGRNSNSGRIGHVGIVVEANNETGAFSFIHASTSGGIKIDTNAGYYGKRYVGAKRIIE